MLKELVESCLEASYDAMLKDIDKALDSGAVDIDSWDVNNNPMVLAKTITAALLKSESEQWTGKGTSFEKQVKKDINNLLNFI